MVLQPAEILYPSGVSAALDYEAELAVAIGKGGRRIPRSSAADCVWGYTIINDVRIAIDGLGTLVNRVGLNSH